MVGLSWMILLAIQLLRFDLLAVPYLYSRQVLEAGEWWVSWRDLLHVSLAAVFAECF